MEQKRWDFLDMAKGIGIFLVVLGHIEYIGEGTLKWIFSFHMPLFFMVGGVLFRLKKEEERPFSETLFKRVRGILIPYISFSLALLTMAVLDFFLKLPHHPSVSKRMIARGAVDTFTGYGVHILWFLPAYFLAMLLFYLLVRTLKKGQVPAVILILCVGSLMTAERLGLRDYISMEGPLLWIFGVNLLIVFLRSFLALPFVYAGWLLGRTFLRNPVKHRKGEVIWGLLLMYNGFSFSQDLSVFDLHYLYVEPLHYLSAASTCIGLLFLLRHLPVSRILSYLGRNSLIIMCTHASFFVVYYISLGMFFVKKFIPMAQPVFNVGVAVLVCVAELPMIWFINRYFKQMLGRTT